MKLIRKYKDKGARGEEYINYEFLSDAKDLKSVGEICAKIGGMGEFVRAVFRGELDMDNYENEFVARSVDDIKENLDKIEKTDADNGYVELKVDGERVQIGYGYDEDGYVFDVSGTNVPVIKKVAEGLKKI